MNRCNSYYMNLIRNIGEPLYVKRGNEFVLITTERVIKEHILMDRRRMEHIENSSKSIQTDKTTQSHNSNESKVISSFKKCTQNEEMNDDIVKSSITLDKLNNKSMGSERNYKVGEDDSNTIDDPIC